ncbi:hypothetical protein PACTADRAFT_49810 [Pachysolen tannophilus NRRL Y-2460]|uniref:Pheromone-processing carboxypeptidase KEX1 n=1 Tax=Pachysolen tannophilus NRRL Y-2460 TaxID=669874 RepID=A0A1E4TXL2_PACTA|nr:hypothetical protein PACTADRAFT_49810 [Pachysolen tannophilus NRRL Y-2460]
MVLVISSMSRYAIVVSIIPFFVTVVLSLPIPKELKDEYLVKFLPGLDSLAVNERPIMYAGHVEIHPEDDDNYFFWKFIKNDNSTGNGGSSDLSSDIHNRTVFWLNGGPGCSSMDGALMELGPLRINSKQNVEYNKGNWMEIGDLVFVDQPGGTGFSYTSKYDKELYEVSADFVVFLEKYFELFPEDLDKEIYLAGESFAGQYIPYILKAIFEKNEAILKSGNNTSTINMKGALIGNGWISPDVQSASYLPFMVKAGLISQDNESFGDLLKQQEKCQKLINNGPSNGITPYECSAILEKLLVSTKNETAPSNEQCINMYDYSLKDSFPSCGMNWPPLLDDVNGFLRNPKIKEYLNLKKLRQWNECDSAVSRYLTAKNSPAAIEFLPDLLQKIPIALFNGDRDIICNHMGTENMISSMKWGGSDRKGFSRDTDFINWYYDDALSGVIKSERNLTYITVYGASHMVPFDKPAVSRGLVDILTGNIKDYNNGENTGISTPIYSDVESNSANGTIGSTSSNGDGSSDSNTPATSSPSNFKTPHSTAFYIFEVTVVVIILYGIHYFYKYYHSLAKQRPTSILANNASTKNKKAKKQVHWEDEEVDLAEDNNEQNEQNEQIGQIGQIDQIEQTGQHSQENKKDPDPTSHSSNSSFIGSIWGKISGANSDVRYERVNEDIEMSGGEILNNHNNTEFIIDSEEEEEGNENYTNQTNNNNNNNNNNNSNNGNRSIV